MPARAGASHGVAAFITLIVGTILSKFVWDLVPPLGDVALVVVETIRAATGADLPVTEQFAGTVSVMVVLSFIWGIVYHVGRHS